MVGFEDPWSARSLAKAREPAPARAPGPEELRRRRSSETGRFAPSLDAL